MAFAAAPSSCLAHLQQHKAHIFSGNPSSAFRSRENVTRYLSAFFSKEQQQQQRKRFVCRGLDEEGYYVQEEQDYIHPRYPFSHQFNPVDERNPVQKVADELQKITPIKAVKIATIGAAFLTLTEWFLATVAFNPKSYTYGSWALIFWPWPVALLVGAWTSYLAYKQRTKWEDKSYRIRQKDRDNTMLIAGALVWLILVPLGHFQGYIEGFPIIFFTIYFAYFMIDRMIRQRVYGKLFTGPEDKEWLIPVDKATWIGFVGSVIAGHWLAAFEAPPLMLSWNFAWQTKLALVMTAVALALKYYGTYFLLKFSKKVNSPNIAVPFGPYRWVRHPIYGSSILLFSAFCMALRSYGSLALIMAGCLFYYEQLTKREEELLLKNFGDEYGAYRKSVRNKYIPYLY